MTKRWVSLAVGGVGFSFMVASHVLADTRQFEYDDSQQRTEAYSIAISSDATEALLQSLDLDARRDRFLDFKGTEGYRCYWDQIVQSYGSRKVNYGIDLLGPDPYSNNETEEYRPASTAKVFTAMLALKNLGADHRFETKLTWRQMKQGDSSQIADLTLIGSGDPTLGNWKFGEGLTARFREMARKLADQGVQVVHNPVIAEAVDTRWDDLSRPDGWQDDWWELCYAVSPQAINVQNNCASYVLGGVNQGKWAEPEVPVQVILDLKAGRSTRFRVVLEDTDHPEKSAYRIVGTWKRGAARQTIYLPIFNSAEWAARLLTRALVAQGIQVLHNQVDECSSEYRSLSFYSKPVSEIIQPMLKDSVNLLAETMFKAVGQRYFDDSLGLNEAGEMAMQAMIHDLRFRRGGAGYVGDPNLDMLQFKDGSGLSYESQVSPRAMMAMLYEFSRTVEFPALWNGLAIAGVDGTLKNRMKRSHGADYFRGKTGTLTGSYNLVGYVPDLDLQGNTRGYVPFVSLTRTESPYRHRARKVADQLAACLSGWVKDHAKVTRP